MSKATRDERGRKAAATRQRIQVLACKAAAYWLKQHLNDAWIPGVHYDQPDNDRVRRALHRLVAALESGRARAQPRNTRAGKEVAK